MNGAENIEIDNKFTKTVCNQLHNKFKSKSLIDMKYTFCLIRQIGLHSNYDLCNKDYIFQKVYQFYGQFNTTI